MTPNQFEQVWGLFEENTWEKFKILAYDDVGILSLLEDSLEYSGMDGIVTIKDIRRVSYGKQGRDFVNKWVRVDYVGRNGPATVFTGATVAGAVS